MALASLFSLDKLTEIINDTTNDINKKILGFKTKKKVDKKRKKPILIVKKKKKPVKGKVKDISHQSSAYFNRLAEMKARRGNISDNTRYERRRRSKQDRKKMKKFTIKNQNFFISRKSGDSTPKTPKNDENRFWSKRGELKLSKSTSDIRMKNYRDVSMVLILIRNLRKFWTFISPLIKQGQVGTCLGQGKSRIGINRF